MNAALGHDRDIRSSGLDALRSLAVIAVVFFHMGLWADWEATGAGWMGVDLFFVLSGFLIGSQLFTEVARTGEIRFGRFYTRRSLRILPSYLAVVAVYMLFPTLREARTIAPLWKFLTFTQNLGLRRDVAGAFSHAWSLCVEEHFYLTLPVVTAIAAPKLARTPHRARIVVVSLVSAIVVALAIRAALWMWVIPPFVSSREWYNFSAQWMYYPTFAHIDGLVFGVALALLRVYRPAFWEKLRAHPAAMFAFAVATVTMVIIHGDLDAGFGAIASFALVGCAGAALVLAACSNVGERISRRIPFAGTMATLAFTLYLTHKLVLHAGKQHLPSFGIAPYSAVGVIVTIAACLAVAAGVHVLVERPGLSLRRYIDASQTQRMHVDGRQRSGS